MRLSAEPGSFPIDDETQLDAGTLSYNIHVPDHDNNRATADHHGWCYYAGVSRPNSYDYVLLLTTMDTGKMWPFAFDFRFIVGIHIIVKVVLISVSSPCLFLAGAKVTL